MIYRNNQVARAVRHALFASAATAASVSVPAFAQDQQEGSPASEIGTVVVTGSRIPQPNLTSVSPVTSVGSQELKLEGVTRVEDLINNLPQAVADFGGNLSNGATGAATVSLRGLGAQRTLVLVNGRRLMPGDPTQNGNSSPDLNQIPGSLIERVEVLTGGASAVYGADAVAGVVNFIMNDHFEGVRLDAQYSMYQHNNSNAVGDVVDARGFATPDSNVTDGYSRDFTFTLGMNTGDGRGNATVYAGYRTLSALLQSQRDFSACALTSGQAPGNPTNNFVCGGSSTAAPGRFFPVDQDPAASGATIGGGFTIDANNAFIPWNGARDQYNFAPTNYYQRPDDRYTAGLFAHYDLNEHATAYTEFSFMDDKTVAQIAPSGVFLGSGTGTPPFFGNYVVNCNNPLMSASQVQALCTNVGLTAGDDALVGIGRRNVEGGGRQADFDHTSYRAVLGMRGAFADAWTYDGYGLYGTTVYAQNYLNEFSLARLTKALTAVPDPATGNIVCRVNVDADITNDDPNCVPYNLWQQGGVTQGALNYVMVPGFQEGSTKEEVVSGSVTGDLGHYGVKMPWASDGVGVAFGAEYRREESELRTDQAFQTQDLLGQGAPTLNTTGAFDVKELFTEVRLPLVQEKTGMQDLSLEAGYRYSDYSLGFNTDTYKFGLNYSPVDSIRFRGSYQRAVRAPNIQELFLQTRVQLDGQSDPCAGAVDASGLVASGATRAQCALSGLNTVAGPGDQYGNVLENPASQYNGLVGGNPNLDPETADTYSFGFVFTPSFLPRLSWTVDYYDIKVENLIGSVGADLILNNCISGDLTQCGLVHRSPGSGSLWLGNQGFIDDPIINTGSTQTKGIDTEINYTWDMGGNAGRLAFQLIGTYVNEFSVAPLTGSPTYDCAGLYGLTCLAPTPEWRHKLRATWASPWNLDLSLSWRYIDSVNLDSTSSDLQLSGQVFPTDAKFDAVNYLDLAASYTFHGNITARLGINNLTDEDPPITGQSSCPSTLCNGNTFPQVYDTLGRYGFVSVTADF
ncbi:MAG TPA: TonB-dependent receptor [Steroidobacteraceae bacterium]|nr:TonB-dependent receptor [Steroidobacteraceae bacterium]